jgi:hypothetical protein
MIVGWFLVALASFAFLPVGPFLVLIAVLASIATRKTDGQLAEQAIKDAEQHAAVVSTAKWFLGIDPASVEARRQRQAQKAIDNAANVAASILQLPYDADDERQQNWYDRNAPTSSATTSSTPKHYDYDINGERFEVRQPRFDGKWDGRPQDTLST